MIEAARYMEFSKACSIRMTKMYSTSFSAGVRLFDPEFREPICSIYGFVRLADEIVDTFFETDQEKMILDFERDTFDAIECGWSANPVLQAFQWVVNTYKIPTDLVYSFLESMKMDLYLKSYDSITYQKYIYGSAEVVGLMCLRVFLKGDDEKYMALSDSARKLGSAFQKINFLRDIKSDFMERGRMYFPGIQMITFNQEQKKAIESEIRTELDEGLKGIKCLPQGVKTGVYLAYSYFDSLLFKIEKHTPEQITQQRFRINNMYKMYLLILCLIKVRFNLL